MAKTPEAARLRESVAFDSAATAADTYGGLAQTWGLHYACRAEFIYQRGGEQVEADDLAGQATYKVKIRSCVLARAITQNMRMRDTRRNVTYNIREVDAVSDRAWVYIVVQQGVAA